MVCPHCGAETAVRAKRCSSCHGALRTAAPTAAGALTPPPPLSGSGGDQETRLGTAPPAVLAGGPERPLEPGSAFGTRYRILRLLGTGGMGAVYQAWDNELGIAVALKVIRPEVLADPYAARDIERRFKRELLLARQVTHRHVVRIHDIGDLGGIKYLTMPFVEGRDLASVLGEEGRLPVERALRIARQIAAGLQAAHDAGVVHRDLKPENVMLDGDDQALIMDFGISRSSSSAGGFTMTALGAVVGTLEYMAPEQGHGLHVDHRADIYAFGLMLRDLLVGRGRVTSGSNAIAEMMGRMTQAPAPMRATHPEIPAALDALVSRAVDPDPEKRFATTAELVDALNALDASGNPIRRDETVSPWIRWPALAAAGVIVALLAVAAAIWWRGPAPGAPAVERPPVSILIADFENGTGDQVFQGSIEQALGIALEGAPFVSAYSRQEAAGQLARIQPGARLDESGATILARQRGIPVILAGSIAPDGQGYRLDARAIDVAADRRIAGAQVSVRSKSEVLEAVGTLAASLRRELGETEVPAEAGETFTAGSIEAMRAYVRGQELNAAGKPREALEAFRQATMYDPAFGRAYVNMASIHTNLKEDEQARTYYEQALKLLDRMTERERYRTLGIYYLGINRDYEKAIDNFSRLVRAYPADNMGHSNLALAYVLVRDVQRAMEVGRRATELSPDNLLQRTNYATYAMYAGQFDTAVAEASRVLAQNGSYVFAQHTLALSMLAQGKVSEAREGYARLATLGDTGASMASMGLADLEMHLGRYRAALETLAGGIAADEKVGGTGHQAVKLVAQAEAQLALGDRPQAAVSAASAARLSTDDGVQYTAARALIASGRAEEAQAIGASMVKALPAQTRSYGRLIEAALLLQRQRHAEAIDAARGGLKLHDSWAGRALLAGIYAAAGDHVAAQDEWSLCLRRQGEATDVFFADTATLRYLPPVHYWLGRAQEALSSPGARPSYEAFLRLRQQADPPDPLALDAQRRLGR